MKEHRGLAIYKESGKPWTTKELNNVLTYCIGDPQPEDFEDKLDNSEANAKYIYDDGCATNWMYMWGHRDDEPESLCKTLTKVTYESIFNNIQLKTYKVGNYGT